MTERNYHNLHNMRVTNTAPLHSQSSENMLVRTDARPGPERCSSAGGLLGGRRAFPSALKRKNGETAADFKTASDFKTKTTVENFKRSERSLEDEGAARKKRRLTANDDDDDDSGRSSRSSPKRSPSPPPRGVRFDSPPQKAAEAPHSPRQANKRRRRYQRRNSKVSHMFFTTESLGLDEVERKTIENDYSNINGNEGGESSGPGCLPKPLVAAVPSPSSSSTPAMSSSLLSIYRRYGLSPPPSCTFAPISPDTPEKPTVPDALMSSQSELLRRMMEAQRERAIQRKGHLDAARALLLRNASAMSFLRRAHIAGGAVSQGTMDDSLDDAGREWPR